MKMVYGFGGQEQLFHWMFAPNLQFPGDLVYNIVHPHKGDCCEIPMASPFHFLKNSCINQQEKD